MFTIGQKVNRIENREVTGATVIAVDGEYFEIDYDEGGSGWWPADSLIPAPEVVTDVEPGALPE